VGGFRRGSTELAPGYFQLFTCFVGGFRRGSNDLALGYVQLFTFPVGGFRRGSTELVPGAVQAVHFPVRVFGVAPPSWPREPFKLFTFPWGFSAWLHRVGPGSRSSCSLLVGPTSPIPSHKKKLARTNSDQFRPIPHHKKNLARTNSDQFRPTPTNSDRSRPIPAIPYH
jgi:hypothetical protein